MKIGEMLYLWEFEISKIVSFQNNIFVRQSWETTESFHPHQRLHVLELSGYWCKLPKKILEILQKSELIWKGKKLQSNYLFWSALKNWKILNLKKFIIKYLSKNSALFFKKNCSQGLGDKSSISKRLLLFL